MDDQDPPAAGAAGAGGFPALGESIGPFTVRRQLGAGGMGVVYAAWDAGLEREVALKVLAPHLAYDAEFRTRFTREARTQAGLDSAHVVQVYSFGEEEGRLYIATQLVGEGDVGQLMGAGGLPPLAVALDIAAQVAAGIADAHAAGLIHRDIKPGNVLVRVRDDQVRAYVADFGIARVVDAELTRSGGAIGTPAYMAPELHLGAEAGVATDVYSTGCLLWALLTGHSPYGGGSEYQVIRSHVEAPVRQLVGDHPLVAALNRTLVRSMAKRPEQRHPDATALRDDLRELARWAQGVPPPPIVAVGAAQGGPGGGPSGSRPSGPTSGPRASGPHPSGPHPSGPPRGPGPAGPAYRSPPQPAPRRLNPVLLVVVGSALLAVTIVIGVLAGRSSGDEPTTTAEESSSSASPSPTPSPTPSDEPTTYDDADRQVAVDNISSSLQDQLLPAEVSDCAAQRWVDDVGVARLVEEAVLRDDLTVDESTPVEDIDDDVQQASDRAAEVCGDQFADDVMDDLFGE